MFGLSFDIGTTTVVATLVDLTNGVTAAVESTINAQAPYGADVIARMGRAMTGPEAIADLREAVLATVNDLIERVCGAAAVAATREVYECVESPRGEFGVYVVSDGGPKPWRVKFRAPSFVALEATATCMHEAFIADMIAVVGMQSLGPAVTHLVFHPAAAKLQPGAVEEGAHCIGARNPYHQVRGIHQFAEPALSGVLGRVPPEFSFQFGYSPMQIGFLFDVLFGSHSFQILCKYGANYEY
jgi:hypothetical protein